MSATTSQTAGGPPPRGRARQLSPSPFKVVDGEPGAPRHTVVVLRPGGVTPRQAAA